ncbi:unnamed protein product [Closterium sp. NIES-65]|nr:unnamed protein product [Closterium sp. NIES-65]
MTGMNASSLRARLGDPLPRSSPSGICRKELKLEENDFTGAVFEGKFYSPADMAALETLPSRAEVYSKLLGVMQSPARDVVSTLQCLMVLPSCAEVYSKLLGLMQPSAKGVERGGGCWEAPARDLIFTLKAHVQKLEEAEGSQ